MPKVIKAEDVKLTPHARNELVLCAYNGQPTIIGEYRGTRVDALKLANKQTGQKEQRYILRHLVEVGDGDPLTVVEWLPAGSDGSFKPPAAKADLVMVSFSSLKTERGNVEGSGTVKPISKTV